jgi:uncharacterized protein (DUF305 family)
MKRTTMVRRAILVGTVTTTLLVAAACGSGMGGMNHDGTNAGGAAQPTTSASAGATHNDADVAFAQMMIPHHQQAVEMAALAETRAGATEIKQLAAKIKAAQDPEIITMTGWLTAWGMPTAKPGGHNMPGMSGTEGMPGMMSDTDMTKLKAATGVNFDRMFAQMMIAHHNGAIQSAREEKAKGANPDAKALAATIEQAQTAEVATMQTILGRL